MRIRYIGQKPFNVDRMYGSQVLWMGNGDIQLVKNDEMAQQMCASSPLVYEEVLGEPGPGQLASLETAPLAVAVPGALTTWDPDAPVVPEPVPGAEAADPAAAAAYDVLEPETVQEVDGTVVKLKDASFNAIRRHLTDVLHIKMDRPTRDKMLDAIKGFREAEIEAKQNAASQKA